MAHCPRPHPAAAVVAPVLFLRCLLVAIHDFCGCVSSSASSHHSVPAAAAAAEAEADEFSSPW